MSSALEGNLTRNQALWAAWLAKGVTESTPLNVDFHFYATSESAANSLAGALREAGLKDIKVCAERTLWLLKGWTIEVTEHGAWSLEKLQDRTRYFCQLAESLGCEMEGCGAMIPN